MLNWMNPQWQQRHPEAGYGPMPGIGGGGSPPQTPGQPGAVTNFNATQGWGNTTSPFYYWEPESNKKAVNPVPGEWRPNPNYRQQLAQIMAPQWQWPGTDYGRGNNPGYTSSGRSQGGIYGGGGGWSGQGSRTGSVGGISSGGLY